MKFTIDSSALADAVAWAARSLPARPTAPVLAGLLLEAKQTSLTLSGFDLEVSAQISLDTDVEEPITSLNANGFWSHRWTHIHVSD